MKPIKLCVVGAGGFAEGIVPLYQAHPRVAEVSLCEAIPERLRSQAERYKIRRTFSSFEEALRSDIDAVSILTQRWLHAPMAIAALKAGKHVHSAVPAATTLEELHDLVETVKETGLTYMLGETSVYYGSCVYCRERWDAGDFGRFVYGEGEYYHDMSHGFYGAYQHSGGADWKKTASYPPILYATHSVSMILSVTGARMTKVSCFGQVDQHDDGVFQEEVSLWGNRFSNQTALFRTSDGGMARINEFRRVGVSGGRNVRLNLYGTEGAFEEQCNGAAWTDRLGFAPKNVEAEIECDTTHPREEEERAKADLRRFAQVHEKYRHRLPESYRLQPNGHEGSHQFLTDDFVRAATEGTLPFVSVWDAARYNAPGIVAHASSLREGETLDIPDFGAAPR